MLRNGKRPIAGVLCTVILSSGGWAETYRIGTLLLKLPESFRQSSRERETLPPPLPGAEPTIEELAHFRSERGETLHLIYWRGDSPRDRGPMKATRIRTTLVGDTPCEEIRTSLFLGRELKVNALFCRFGDREGFLLYSPDLPADRFHELSRGISRITNP
jgi:hypothetical protein